MPRKKKVSEETNEVTKVEESETKTKKSTRSKKSKVVEEKVEEVVETKKATIHDFEIIKAPHVTEKTSALTSDLNQFTFLVSKHANKTEIRHAIERIYNVHVTGISIVNKKEKVTSRGSRYKGKISGFKKAIVALKEGETINIYAE